MNWERVFQFLAAGFGGAAGYFLWRDNWDAVFLLAVLGSVSFFLSIRAQVKRRLAERAADTIPPNK